MRRAFGVVVVACILAAVSARAGARRSSRDFGWGLGRKIRYTLALLIFAALGVLLAMWGALVPWHY